MALKRIYLPTVMKFQQFDSDERKAKQRESFRLQIENADKELNAALNEGYTLATQYDTDADWETGVTFVMHKSDPVSHASPIAEADLKLIAEAWDSVDHASPISILFADPAQVEVLLNLAKAVEAFLFPKGK